MPKQSFSNFPSNLQNTYEWLMSLRLVNCTLDEMPHQCIDGTLVCRIIEKLEGRNCSLGFHRSPKTFSACRANLKHGLEYLRRYPKFQSNFLWSYDSILHGDEETIWGLLADIQRFYCKPSRPKTSNILRPTSVPLRQVSKYSNFASPAKREVFSQVELIQVRNWLDELGLSYLLRPGLPQMRDPMRNGVLLAKVLNQVKEKFDFFSHPQNMEEVWDNIRSVVFIVKDEIKGVTIEELMEEQNVWILIGKIMKTYKSKDKFPGLPYSPAEIKNLQHSLFKWVFGLKPFTQFYPENFLSLCKSLKTGVVLVKIIEKILRVEIEHIKFPSLDQDCMKNIELAFENLKDQNDMSKGYLWEPVQILKANPLYITALLEDLHRFSAGLPARKIGEDYHSDGPFYGKQLNFSISYTDEKSIWNPNSVYLSPDKSIQVKSMINSRTSSPLAFRTASNFRNSLDMSIGNISPKVKKEKQKNLAGFDWIEKIGVKVPKDLDLAQEKISRFKNGELLCEILQKLESKNFPGVSKMLKTAAAAAKNVSVAFGVLKKKSAFGVGSCFIESKVLEGDGEHIRKLLKEIHRLYQNTIFALMKFNKTFNDSVI